MNNSYNILQYNGYHDFETIEFILDKDKSNDKELYYNSYDANLCPLPNMSKWDKSHIEDVKKYLYNKYKDIFDNHIIYLDDIIININCEMRSNE